MLGPLNPKNSSVLIVDDSPDDTFVVAKALETFGIKAVFHAETAEQALSFLARQTCDVVLIDYNLPGMNGLRLLERIRESWQAIRAIIVTGADDEQVAVSAMKAGAADYVSKDELLTSGVIRSLQTALRERVADGEAERRTVLAAGEDKLEVASEEAEWLLEGSGSDSERGFKGSSAGGVDYGAEDWTEAVRAFTRYLRQSFARYPELAGKDEETLLHLFLGRGMSPRDLIALYRAALRSLVVENVPPPFNPGLCLTRLLARAVDEYQRQLSLSGDVRRVQFT